MATGDGNGGPGGGRAAAGEGPPGDAGNRAYLAWFLMGVGVLLPWNAFVTADDYFLMLYPASFHVERTFAVCYFLTNLACILLLIRHGQRIDARRRALFGFWGYVACLVAVPLLDATLHTDPQGAVPRPGFRYALTLLAVLACGAFNGVGQGSIFGLAGNLPFRYNAALNAGVAGSGLIVNAARLLTKGAMPDDESGLRASAYIYFGLATATCLLCVYVFQVAMPRMPVLAYYAARTTHNKDVVVGDGALEDETDQLIGDQDEERGGRSAVSRHPDSVAPPFPSAAGLRSTATRGLTEPDPPEPFSLTPGQGEAGEGGLWGRKGVNQTGLAKKMADGGPSPAVNKALVLKSIWHYSAAIVLTYWVTFTLFPGSLTEDVASQALGDWYGILLITAYNLSDLAGRVASNYLLVARKTVLGLAVGRIALVSLFFLRSVKTASDTD